MIHIMITVPVALSFYLGPFGFGTFNTLCPLGIFVILGIGADDVFIVVVSSHIQSPVKPVQEEHGVASSINVAACRPVSFSQALVCNVPIGHVEAVPSLL